MKISIWQQFSSNHSAHFIVVGEFESVQRATEVTQELRDILDQLQKWWEENGDVDSYYKHHEMPKLTPIEQHLRDKYEVEWLFSVIGGLEPDENSIKQYKEYVFVENLSLMIWKGPQPFNELMAKFGSNVYLDVSESQSHPYRSLSLDVMFLLPEDEDIAQSISEDIQNELQWIRNPEHDLNRTLKFAHKMTDYENMKHDGKKLKIEGVSLILLDSYFQAFTELLDHLKKLGVKDIECTFHTSPHFR